jgi:hypothetical protein
MIRVNEATEVVSVNYFRIPNGFARFDGGGRSGTDDELRTRNARGNKHDWNEGEIFHG